MKIDTEGHDCVILQGFYECGVRPDDIHFESNELTPHETVTDTIKLFETLGYRTVERGYNTHLTLKKPKVAIFSEKKWAFGRIHHALIKHLKHLYDFEYFDWSKIF